MECYNYKFKLKDSQGNYYKLRAEQISACLVRYRAQGSVDSFTEVTDYNIDEKDNSLWVRLEGMGPVELVLNIVVEPLRSVTTSLITLDLVPYTTEFEVTTTPVPVDTLQGFSPRIIDGYWYQYSDMLRAFENTGIRAESTVIEPGSTTDIAESNNPNPISSGGVYNLYMQQNNINQQYNQQISSILSSIETLESQHYSIKMNGRLYLPDPFFCIDLGTVGGSGPAIPATHMLDRNTEINGIIYPKGTEVDDDDNVYATDPNYRYSLDNRLTNSPDNTFKALITIYDGCTLNISWKVYSAMQNGVIYCTKAGASWNFYCTNKEVASTFQFYQYNGWDQPILVIRGVSNPLAYTTRINITCDKACGVRNMDLTGSEQYLKKIDPFLTQLTPDTIEISSSTYSVAPDNILITNYIVTVGGAVDFVVTDEMSSAQSFEFAITQANTVITWSDGQTTSASDTLQPGDVVEFIYNGPDSYYWNVTSGGSFRVRDVVIDGQSCVASEVAYINSLTQEEVNILKSIFVVE